MHLWEAHRRSLPATTRGSPGYNPINEPGDVDGQGRSGRSTTGWSRRSGRSTPRTSSSWTATPTPPTSPSSARSTRTPSSSATTTPWPDSRTAGRTRGTPAASGATGQHLEQAFDKRTDFQRETGTPLWVGEFGPVYTGDPAIDAQRYQILRDQLEIYDAHAAGWSIWTYKDVGLQGLVHADPRAVHEPLRRLHRQEAPPRRRPVGLDDGGDGRRSRAPAPADGHRVPVLGAVPVGGALPGRRPDPAHPHRAGAASPSTRSSSAACPRRSWPRSPTPSRWPVAYGGSRWSNC